MKRLRFAPAAFAVLLVFVLASGCYTTFYGVRQNDSYDGEAYPTSYSDDNSYYDYSDPYAYDESATQLTFQPTRFVVEKNYYNYGQHVRKVRYLIYNDDPWYVPYDYIYYRGPQVGIYFSIGFHNYYDYGPWYAYTYYPVSPIIWAPPYGWYDYWCGWPVYFPVYYPVYYPYPVYYDHGYDHVYTGNFKKRTWDRRAPVTNSRIAGRGSERIGKSGSTSSPNPVISTRPPTRVSERGSAVAERSNSGNGRIIKRSAPESKTSSTGREPARTITRESSGSRPVVSGTDNKNRSQIQTETSTGSRSVSRENVQNNSNSGRINRSTENNGQKQSQRATSGNSLIIPQNTRQPASPANRTNSDSRNSSVKRTRTVPSRNYNTPALPVPKPVNTSRPAYSVGKSSSGGSAVSNSSRSQAPRSSNISRPEPSRSASPPAKPSSKPAYSSKPSSGSKNTSRNTVSAPRKSNSTDSDKNKSNSSSGSRKRR